MSNYKLTQKVITLVNQLMHEGYDGDVKIVNTKNTYTGVIDILGDDSIAICIDGFCKEQLFIVEDTDTNNVLLVGRYDIEEAIENPTVDDIVGLSWNMYKTYKDSKYNRPSEFESLYRKYGYLKTVTKTLKEDIEL